MSSHVAKAIARYSTSTLDLASKYLVKSRLTRRMPYGG